MNSNYPCPLWLAVHIFAPINHGANHLHVEQFLQIVFIFSRQSNPNRRFHLFSLGESLFSGIFFGPRIVWKRVIFCTPPSPFPPPSAPRRAWSVHWWEAESDYYLWDFMTGRTAVVTSRRSLNLHCTVAHADSISPYHPAPLRLWDFTYCFHDRDSWECWLHLSHLIPC